ncbi:CPLN1 protein, partial [Formicarius rufipectus]|nr:CPLN1 protein [Formicarius rufipectus]
VNASSTLLESNSKETGFTSPSQDFHSSVPIKPFHLLAPSSNIQKTVGLIPVEKKTSYSNGFPLLRLKSSYFKPEFLHPVEMSSAFARPPPVPRVAWCSSDSLWNHQSSYTPRKSKAKEDFSRRTYDPEIPRQMHAEERRWAETVHRVPPKYPKVNEHEGQPEVPPGQQFSADVSVHRAPVTQNLAGIPLLHLRLDPVPRVPPPVKQSVTTTLIPIKPAKK